MAKILIVDDRPQNLLVLESLIDDAGVELIKAGSGNEALAQILDHDFALVLLDVQMPDMDGYEVAELMRSNRHSKNIPIIFVTAKEKEQTQIFKGYDAGAVDYLFKPLEPIILKSKIGIFLELYRQKEELKDKTRELDRRLADLELLQQQLEQTNKQLTLLSTVDGLTGLLNRRSFDENYQEEWQRAIRNRQPIALLMVDIDYFKAYNDCYGHILGDTSLKVVAQVLAGAAQRQIDRVARYGGEEFAAILPGTDLSGAETLAERMRKAVQLLGIQHAGAEYEKILTVSIGVASTNPTQGTDPSKLIEIADARLYSAKAAGRNCWRSQGF